MTRASSSASWSAGNEAARLAAAEFAKAAEKAAQAPDGGAVLAAGEAAEKPRHAPDLDPDSDVVGCLIKLLRLLCLWLALQSQPACLACFLVPALQAWYVRSPDYQLNCPARSAEANGAAAVVEASGEPLVRKAGIVDKVVLRHS